MKIRIATGFHVFVAQQGKADRKVQFTAGKIVDEADLPAGQSAQDWIEKGLATAEPAVAGSPAPEAGPAV